VTLTHTLVLDPRISYEGIWDDYSETPDLLEYLEKSMTDLHEHFTLKYASARSMGTQCAFTKRPHASSSTGDLSMVSFTSRYKRKDNLDRDERRILQAPTGGLGCMPSTPVVGRATSSVPSTFCLAHDILTIPGRCYLYVMMLRF
jgi:hypothetical protein